MSSYGELVSKNRKRSKNTSLQQIAAHLQYMESDYHFRSGTINSTLGDDYIEVERVGSQIKCSWTVGDGPKNSIIVPIHNGELWINDCFSAILSQTAIEIVNLEVCVCNDASTDNTMEILATWYNIFQKKLISLKVYNNLSCKAGGVGYSKNRAVSISSGDYLCFQDVDDIMLPNRILCQYNRALREQDNVIIGSKFTRQPQNSTIRYTKWANTLTEEQLNFQIYTSHGPTIIMPTWFCHRSTFKRVGGFSETGKGIPEDLLFFYKHLDFGGKVCRVDDCLLIYTFHPSATTFTIHEDTIWKIRLERLQRDILSKWQHFTIWNAGKQGRKLFNSLFVENQKKVLAMCDVNKKLIGKTYAPYDPLAHNAGQAIKIVHFQNAQSPFVICVKMDMTNGEFENNLKSLQLEENVDYVYFS